MTCANISNASHGDDEALVFTSPMGTPTARQSVKAKMSAPGRPLDGFSTASPAPPVLRAPDGLVDPATIDGMRGFLRNAYQLTGLMILAGPGGEDVGILRQQYGCRPEVMIEVEASGLKWKSSYIGLRSLCWWARRSGCRPIPPGPGGGDRARCGGGSAATRSRRSRSGGWMTAELRFLDEQRPWERAGVIVAGTLTGPLGAGEWAVASPAVCLPAGKFCRACLWLPSGLPIRLSQILSATLTTGRVPGSGAGAPARPAASGRGRSEPAAAKAARNRATMSHRALRRPADWASTPMAGGPARLAK